MSEAPEYIVDPALKEWADETLKTWIDAINREGGYRAAARMLGIANHSIIIRRIQTLEKRAARSGYAPKYGMTRPTAPGFRAQRISTYHYGDKETGRPPQWVIQTADQEKAEQIMRDWVDDLVAHGARGLAPITAPPAHANQDLLSIYAIGDPHFGMYAWAAETGDDFDLPTAERLTQGAIDRLVSSSPPSSRALLLQAGDMFHADNSKNQTPESGAVLDVDTRHAKVMQVGLRSMVYAIRRLLEKHEQVDAWMLPGNHDPQSSFALALCLQAFFENEPRVKIDLNPGLYKFLRFGKVLIGGHHGHGAKPADLPLLMAVDRSKDWGETDHRYVYMGHIHHDTVKEIMGVRVESLRTLATKDAWHAGKGYRAGRDMRLIVHHRDHGEVERHTCGASQLAA